MCGRFKQKSACLLYIQMVAHDLKISGLISWLLLLLEYGNGSKFWVLKTFCYIIVTIRESRYHYNTVYMGNWSQIFRQRAYAIIDFLGIICLPVSLWNNVLETGVCLHPHIKIQRNQWFQLLFKSYSGFINSDHCILHSRSCRVSCIWYFKFVS